MCVHILFVVEETNLGNHIRYMCIYIYIYMFICVYIYSSHEHEQLDRCLFSVCCLRPE